MASFIKSHKNSLALIAVLAAILVGWCVFLLVEARHDAPVAGKKSAYDAPLHNNNSPNKTNPNDTPTQAEENSNNVNSASSDIAGIINFSSVVGNNLTIRATINQSLSDGTCTLTLTRASDSKSVTKTAKVVINPSSTTCAGFDVPVDELGPGSWAISIKVDGGGKSGEIRGNVSL